MSRSSRKDRAKSDNPSAVFMGKPYVKKGKKLSKNLEYSMKTDYYPVEDYIPMKDRDDLNIVVRMDGEYYNLFGGLVPVKIWAVPTGEFRTPKRGGVVPCRGFTRTQGRNGFINRAPYSKIN